MMCYCYATKNCPLVHGLDWWCFHSISVSYHLSKYVWVWDLPTCIFEVLGLAERRLTVNAEFQRESVVGAGGNGRQVLQELRVVDGRVEGVANTWCGHFRLTIHLY